MHKVQGCEGKWVDIATLRQPRLQMCDACRATRQKPGEESLVDMSRQEGLARLREDLVGMDPVHQEDGKWWFYDETWTSRHGPFDTKDIAEQELVVYVDRMVRD